MIKNSLEKYKPDYEHWFKKKDITEDEAYLVIQGIDPKHFQKYLANNFRNTPDEYHEFIKTLKNIRTPYYLISSNPFLYYDDVEENLKYIKDLLKHLNIKFSNLVDLCGLLYEKAFTLPEELIIFLKNKQIIALDYFDKYKDYTRYTLNHDKWINSDKKLTKEEVIFIVLNLDPISAKQIINIEKNNSRLNYRQWKSNEDIFFYKAYEGFLKEKRYYANTYDMICRFNDIDKEFEFNGNIFSFLNDLYNAGWVFHEELMKYLNSIGKMPKYHENSQIVGLYKMYSGMLYWKMEDLEMLVSGFDPISKKRILTLLNICKVNPFSISRSGGLDIQIDCRLYCKHNKTYVSTLEIFDNYDDNIKKYDEKNKVFKYKSQFLINWILDNTFIVLPKVMADCFSEDKDN
ncbi:hypothetical protein ACFL0U_01480 [Pseudomonadota bacterium]